MPTLWISEYAMPTPTEPALCTQTVLIQDESQASSPFQAQTKSVRLHADSPCSIRFGTAKATREDARLFGTEIFVVTYSATAGVSVIATGESEQMDANGALAFLAVIGDPAKAKLRYDELTTLKADAVKTLAAAAERERNVVAKEAALAGRENAVAQAEAQLDVDRQSIARARVEHNAQVENFTASRTDQEQRIKESAQSLEERGGALDREEARFKAWAQEVGADLQANQSLFLEREKALQAREAKVTAGEADYKARLAKLKALTA